MRDYIGELKSIGFSIKAIAKQAGLTAARLLKPFKSGTKEYEAIRNTNRRLASEYLRQHGATPAQVGKLRRAALNPEAKPLTKNIVRKIKSHYAQGFFQYYIYGEFHEPVYGSRFPNVMYQYGFSSSYRRKVPVTERLIKKCVENARGKLGGTNWQLIKILEQGWQVYELTNT